MLLEAGKRWDLDLMYERASYGTEGFGVAVGAE